MAFSEPPLWPDWTTRMGMSGRLDPSMSARRANTSKPLCGAGWTKVTKARDSVGATTVDQSMVAGLGERHPDANPVRPLSGRGAVYMR
jgi:hypothetical protein